MQKLFTICLSLMLLFSTAGVAITKHYCGEMLQNISFLEDQKSCCEGEEMPEDCCTNEADVFKAEDFQFSPYHVNLEFAPYLLYSVNFPEPHFISRELGNPLTVLLHTPVQPEEPIFLRVQSFLL